MSIPRKINILLVDDRPDGLVTLEAVLRSENYHLVTASSGKEALAAILEYEFAVIILDVQMPEMDGYETAAFIKKREKSKYIPIIFVTAINKDPYFIGKGYEVGAVDYLSKPFDPKILQSKVAVFAELFRMNQALNEQANLLKQSEEAKRILIESARDIIATTSKDGILTSLNPAFETLTGWKSSDWIGKHFNTLVDPDELPHVLNEFTEILAGNPRLYETLLMSDSGKSVWVEVSSKPMWSEGEIIGASALVRDISERKAAERERKLRTELERSNTELEQFAHICSHDLQEPLRTMSGFAGLLKEKVYKKIDSDADEMLEGLLEGAYRMSYLISDLLEYAHVGATEIPMSDVQSHLVLEQAFRNLNRIIQDSGTIITSTELPTVFANEILLLQVFQNIISNAIKFRSNESPLIEISSKHYDGVWEFCIRDNGIGFKMEYADKIFQVFKRLHHSSQYPGTGIGLGICKRIIERQGGRIWAESEVGKGSAFYFTLHRGSTNIPGKPQLGVPIGLVNSGNSSQGEVLNVEKKHLMLVLQSEV